MAIRRPERERNDPGASSEWADHAIHHRLKKAAATDDDNEQINY